MVALKISYKDHKDPGHGIHAPILLSKSSRLLRARGGGSELHVSLKDAIPFRVCDITIQNVAMSRVERLQRSSPFRRS
jgi:hypothetical protein